MTDKAIRSEWGMTEDGSLELALARSRVAPDYTMGALAQQTSVPPDTLRSWERRYDFPKPARTQTNRRLYSERDIVAVIWLREQTELGQGISEAIAMLRSRMPDDDEVSTFQPFSEPESTVSPGTAPIDILANALLSGDMNAAQSTWDEMAITLSTEALGGVIFKLDQQRDHDDEVSANRARAFLLRKAMLLLDDANPDRGLHSICLITSDSHRDTIPSTILASTLARIGYQVITPFQEITSLAAVSTIHQCNPEGVILIAVSPDQAATFGRLIPGTTVYRWFPDDGIHAIVEQIDSSQQFQRDH